jgi:LPXTG-site transpeptidase (sortase) family protein
VRPGKQGAPNFVVLSENSMKNKWRAFRNSFLLVTGLGIIGFSVYREVLSFNQTDQDMIGGKEIVVISENTPVVSAALSNDGTSRQYSASSLSVESTAQNNFADLPNVPTGSPQDLLKTTPDKSSQDTFLTQIEKKPRSENAGTNIPDRIVIPTIQLSAPVIIAGSRTVQVSDQTFDQWVAPNQFAAGWHGNSAYLGEKGNTVINGHHNEFGKVFGNLINLKPGETIYVYSGDKVFPYIISNKMILKEKNEDLQTRLANSSWIQPSEDERLTLITCWPPETNTHRLIIVAIPYISSPERVSG